jgi:hypothetical protein
MQRHHVSDIMTPLLQRRKKGLQVFRTPPMCKCWPSDPSVIATLSQPWCSFCVSSLSFLWKPVIGKSSRQFIPHSAGSWISRAGRAEEPGHTGVAKCDNLGAASRFTLASKPYQEISARFRPQAEERGRRDRVRPDSGHLLNTRRAAERIWKRLDLTIERCKKATSS